MSQFKCETCKDKRTVIEQPMFSVVTCAPCPNCNKPDMDRHEKRMAELYRMLEV